MDALDPENLLKPLREHCLRLVSDPYYIVGEHKIVVGVFHKVVLCISCSSNA